METEVENNNTTGYTELNVWKEARALVKNIYEFTGNFPENQRCGLALQTRETAITVPSRIAEGAGRKQPNASLKYLLTAKGALFELETLVYIAQDLGYCTEQDAQALIDKIINSRKLLFGYIRFKERKMNGKDDANYNHHNSYNA
jgi:four helix bundle protein